MCTLCLNGLDEKCFKCCGENELLEPPEEVAPLKEAELLAPQMHICFLPILYVQFQYVQCPVVSGSCGHRFHEHCLPMWYVHTTYRIVSHIVWFGAALEL